MCHQDLIAVVGAFDVYLDRCVSAAVRAIGDVGQGHLVSSPLLNLPEVGGIVIVNGVRDASAIGRNRHNARNSANAVLIH